MLAQMKIVKHMSETDINAEKFRKNLTTRIIVENTVFKANIAKIVVTNIWQIRNGVPRVEWTVGSAE